jgi:hypothetical protein
VQGGGEIRSVAYGCCCAAISLLVCFSGWIFSSFGFAFCRSGWPFFLEKKGRKENLRPDFFALIAANK